NSDQGRNSDFRADVRSLSFSVDLSAGNGMAAHYPGGRQDFSLQNTTTLPINDARAFLATMKVITAANPLAGLLPLPLKDKLRVARTMLLAQLQMMQKIRP